MNEIKQTPEPWPDGDEAIVPPRSLFNVELSQMDYNRARACVNACAGMVNPEREIAALKEQRDELLAQLTMARKIIDNLAEIVHGKKADGSTIERMDAVIAKAGRRADYD